MPPRKRDCRKADLDSDLGVGSPSLLMMVLLLELLIRKKFLIFCGKSFEPPVCFGVLDMPEKLRFSLCDVEVFDEELKSCVILAARALKLGNGKVDQSVE